MITADTANSATVALLRAGMEAGTHIGAQLVARVEGKTVMDIALGKSRLAADALDPAAGDVPMHPDTLMLWLSAGKPVTAAAVMLLIERGQLALDQPVASVIPEFASHGKEAITLRHLLTHTAGIRGTDLAYPFSTWRETLEKIHAMKLERDWTPGAKAGYHAHTSWYVLGELIERVTHQPHDAWIREYILEPTGMHDTWLAMTPEMYRGYGERIGYLYDTSTEWNKGEPHVTKRLANVDTELAASRPRPSASCRGPMRELARFYEMLRLGGTLDGVRILSEPTVHAMTTRQRVGMHDVTFRQTLDWGLGLILNSSRYGPAIPYQFGPHASPDTFGHGGSQSSSGFCDPPRQLVVALFFNGSCGEAPHDRRLRATLKALYEELGLA